MIADHLLMTPTLLRRFEIEAYLDGGDGRYYAVMERAGGAIATHNPGSPEVEPDQLMWAMDVLRLVNREVGHGGVWVVSFSNPVKPSIEKIYVEYDRYALIWLDQDGDPQFTVEWVKNDGEMRDFADVLITGRHATANKCEASWQQWHLLMRDVLLPEENQTFKRAQGQAPTSSRH